MRNQTTVPANSDELTYHEMNFVLALVCLICLLGIIITLEVVTIVDARRAADLRVQTYELQRAAERERRETELRNEAAGRCFKAAELRGLDFVQVCSAWVYRNN